MVAKGFDIKFLRKLLEMHGVSGNEKAVRNLIVSQIKPHVDNVFQDNMGNLIAHQRGSGPKVMVAAHMDEIGLMVRTIEENGMITVTGIGGLSMYGMVGQMVHIKTTKDSIFGTVSTKQISAGTENKKMVTTEDLIVDTGLTKKELESRGVTIGTYISPEKISYFLGNNDIICGKSLDDRIGCFILLELAKRLSKYDNNIYYVFTVQEEFGLYGSKTSTFDINPDWAIAVDTTVADDALDNPMVRMGGGPCITIKDGEFIANPFLIEKMKMFAKKNNIPYQLEAVEVGTTDAANMSISRGGVPAVALTVPVRNIHLTIETAKIVDIEQTIDLLTEILKKPPKIEA